MVWPARSPDVNPIEHVWRLLGKRVRSRLTPHSNLQQLRNVLTPILVAATSSEANHTKRLQRHESVTVAVSEGLHLYPLFTSGSASAVLLKFTSSEVALNCAVSSTQKFLVQQHITTSKHQANKQLNSKQRQLFLTQPTTSNVRSEFNIDLCRSLISADIPLYKLKNKVFREFLEKYTQHTIPDESTLRKTYTPSIYDETIQKIRDEIKDSLIWVSIDETPDKEGRLVGNVVIGLLSEQYSERILLHCDVLEKCNNKTIVKLFNEAMGILWPKGIMYDNVLFFISDAALICEKVFLKAPSRVNVLKEMYPEIPLPPKPILTRWGTWLEAVEYYAEHIDSINNVLLALDSEDAVSIDTAKTVTCDISVKNDLAHIQHTFSCIIKTLKSLQNRHLSLSESFEIINSTVEQLNRGRVHINPFPEYYNYRTCNYGIKSRRLGWAGHVARMDEFRNAHRVLVGRPEEKIFGEAETSLYRRPPEAADSLDRPPWNVVQRWWMASAMAPEADLLGGGFRLVPTGGLGEFAESGMVAYGSCRLQGPVVKACYFERSYVNSLRVIMLSEQIRYPQTRATKVELCSTLFAFGDRWLLSLVLFGIFDKDSQRTKFLISRVENVEIIPENGHRNGLSF
ncbi:hypothetical protein ANN_08117 [Periplaneta americana]|uniref:Uncharacterized protein n=1 Tax=Periplaneta americana TaxID=6978 RepID=A0ABQ8T1R5_PERAM|nr:hypothetical protein ANN_08117 [Periplaneta americana]